MSKSGQQERILGVAKRLFTERGFSNVAVRDICRAAKVTPPTVYYYFKNKEALFDAVVRETITMNEFIDRLNAESKAARGTESKIRAFSRTYLLYFPRNLMNVGLYIRRSTELDSLGKIAIKAELARIQSLLDEIIRSGITQGELRNTDPRMATECLLGMMNRFVFQRIHFQRNYNAAEAASYLAEFFLNAMKTPTRRSELQVAK